MLLLSCSCLLLYISISVLENKMSTVLRSDRDLLLHSIFSDFVFRMFRYFEKARKYIDLLLFFASSLPLSNKSEALYFVVVFAIVKQV